MYSRFWYIFILVIFNVISQHFICAYPINSVADVSLPFQDCGSEFELLSLKVSSCTKIPCQMPLGESVSISVEFKDFGKAGIALKHNAQWNLNLVNRNASVSPNLCTKNCTYNGQEGKVFTANILVEEKLPALKGSLRWEVFNDKAIRVLCYKIPVSIVY